MPISELLLTILAIMIGSVGQLLIKMGLNIFCFKNGALSIMNIWGKLPQLAMNYQIVGALLCFFVSAALWMVVMSKRDISQIYPFIALSHLFVATMAYIVLHEQIGPLRIIGIAIITIGVVVLAQDKVTSAPLC